MRSRISTHSLSRQDQTRVLSKSEWEGEGRTLNVCYILKKECTHVCIDKNMKTADKRKNYALARGQNRGLKGRAEKEAQFFIKYL